MVIENRRIKTRIGQANTGKFLSQVIHTGKESDIVTGLVTHLYIIVRDRACGERRLQIRILQFRLGDYKNTIEIDGKVRLASNQVVGSSNFSGRALNQQVNGPC